jgi:hypothetical protein
MNDSRGLVKVGSQGSTSDRKENTTKSEEKNVGRNIRMEANGTATSDQRPALSCPNNSDDMEKRWWPKWKKREGEQKGDLKEHGDHTILNRPCGPGQEMMGFSRWESQTKS